MKYVLDASLAVRWVLRDLLQAKARQLRTAYQNKVHELLAPDIFIAEVAGALTKAERQEIIRVGHAALLHDEVMNDLPWRRRAALRPRLWPLLLRRLPCKP